MNKLVYDCCEGLLIGIDSSLPLTHKIMEFSRANVAESSSFLMSLGLVRHRPPGSHPVDTQHQGHDKKPLIQLIN